MTPVDVFVGERIRFRRIELGMTQTELADKVAVRFQQVQKYENGQNRVAASRLWHIAEALDVPVNYFFDNPNGLSDMDKEKTVETRRNRELVTLFEDLPETQKNAVMSFLRSLRETA